MAVTNYCPGGGKSVAWERITRGGMLRCPVCNRRLHFRSNPDSCARPCVNPTVPEHKARVKRPKAPNRKPTRARGRGGRR